MTDFYPKVRVGDDVEFAIDPHANACQFRLGKVAVPKNNSCDVIVFTDRGTEYRHDVLHIDDPLAQTTRLWAEPGRGVFRLAPHEIERRIDRDRLAQHDAKLERLERHIEQAVLANALVNDPPTLDDQAKPRPRGRIRNRNIQPEMN